MGSCCSAEAAQVLLEDGAGVAEPRQGGREGAEAACAMMDAAAEALAKSMIVDFVAEKGASQQVIFSKRATGLSLALSGGACCRAGPAEVAVKKVEKESEAESLGVKRGWLVKAINGTEVTGLEHACKVLAEQAEKLPEA
eukprot:SRR837773.17392.p2 GENE.SRR837773.17392~~SRR837773.17392.p2  ORF type:complete len:163 (-),score=63.70 SRR837773.17392:21-440(-)